MSKKAALITGSATGIGRAAALRFAREGFAVADLGSMNGTIESMLRMAIAAQRKPDT